ncbi:MAG TPA: protease complex subunit PrcB family protein [Candidatus Paceibacterota bacterium]|nr:protease complex subunit PrcB family protein [Candidatus Paceibacterota bacterium]
MKAFPVLGVAAIAILIGGGLFYLQSKPAPAVTYVPLPDSAASETVAFRTLESGGNAAKVADPKYYAAYSQAGLLRLWSLAHGSDGTLPPNVDFAKEYVIGVFAGQKPTGGYELRVTGVSETKTTRTVSVTLSRPGAGCLTTEALTSPYVIIAVPVSDAALTHKESQTSVPCK